MALVLSVAPAQGQATAHSELITADANAPSRPFPHFWEKMFGSGRAILSLRESYRRDLREIKEATDFEYVRFHAIFHDEVGVYQEDSEGRATYNFSYLDQIYDGLLANLRRLAGQWSSAVCRIELHAAATGRKRYSASLLV